MLLDSNDSARRYRDTWTVDWSGRKNACVHMWGGVYIADPVFKAVQ